MKELQTLQELDRQIKETKDKNKQATLLKQAEQAKDKKIKQSENNRRCLTLSFKERNMGDLVLLRSTYLKYLERNPNTTFTSFCITRLMKGLK